MSRTTLLMAAFGGSAALLLGAFGFQAMGYAPCQLCLWQRWPHAAAILIALLAVWAGEQRQMPWFLWLGAAAVLASAAIGIFHVGVEQKWWEGLASCTANALAGVSVDDLLSTRTTVGAPVRCDQVAWSLFGISMAGFNALFSLALAAIWVRAARA
jgi:disulfide bond formation protein DsbB